MLSYIHLFFGNTNSSVNIISDNLQDIASFEGGSRELPSYKSSSQQTPTSSQIQRSIEVNRNSLVSVVKDT